MSNHTASTSRPFDLMDLPGAGRFLRWQHSRTALQVPLLLIAALMVFDGLAGPQLAPKNLATVLTWVHYRGLVVLALLVAGNLFCMACPFMLVRNLVRRVHNPARIWPRRLRNKWLAGGLFVGMLFAYELFDLWARPAWTAGLIVAYFCGAVLVDSLFRGASFCKYLCPLGQFNFLSSLLSPLEVKVREAEVCADCQTKDCIKGNALRGCELWLFQPRKFGNLDCTFCLDCVHACPYDNVGISGRLPASELWADPRRSGIGRFSRRPDVAALAALFAFGALLNAFAMVTPVYAVEDWLAELLHTSSELPVLAILFVVGLVIVPAGLLGLAAWLSRWGGTGRGRSPGGTIQPSLNAWAARYAYALIPMGFGIWLAHYAFHFLTGFWTFVPVVQSFVADILGTPLLGAPRWDLGPLLPASWLYPLELGLLGLGWFGSLLVAYRLATAEGARPDDGAYRAWGAFVPWAVLLSLLFAAAIWLMGQPMEMRGTFMVG
ncbi:MAG: FesM [Anaerolineae bacterium]